MHQDNRTTQPANQPPAPPANDVRPTPPVRVEAPTPPAARTDRPARPRHPHLRWLVPVLVAVVSFAGWTNYESLQTHTTDGWTWCMPGGPVVSIRDGLDPATAQRTRIHEERHAAQCRSMGAVAYHRTHNSAAGRLALEAGAHCAEWPVDRAKLPIGLFRANKLDDLTEAYGDRLAGVTRDQKARAVVDSCLHIPDRTPPNLRKQALNPGQPIPPSTTSQR